MISFTFNFTPTMTSFQIYIIFILFYGIESKKIKVNLIYVYIYIYIKVNTDQVVGSFTLQFPRSHESREEKKSCSKHEKTQSQRTITIKISSWHTFFFFCFLASWDFLFFFLQKTLHHPK